MRHHSARAAALLAAAAAMLPAPRVADAAENEPAAKPKPAAKVEEFAGNGVERVVYFSAAISADSIHSQYDVPDLVNRARVADGLPLTNLGAWNDDPLVIQAIKEKIDARLNA